MNKEAKAKTVLLNDDVTVKLINCKDGKVYPIMPAISDMEIYKDEDGVERAMRMWFMDGTSTQVVLQKGDTYNFEHAVSVCIMKKLLNDITGGNGHQAYNKLVRMGCKEYASIQECNRKLEEMRKEAAEAARKRYEKKVRRDERHNQKFLDEMTNVFANALRIVLSERDGQDEQSAERDA